MVRGRKEKQGGREEGRGSLVTPFDLLLFPFWIYTVHFWKVYLYKVCLCLSWRAPTHYLTKPAITWMGKKNPPSFCIKIIFMSVIEARCFNSPTWPLWLVLSLYSHGNMFIFALIAIDAFTETKYSSDFVANKQRHPAGGNRLGSLLYFNCY